MNIAYVNIIKTLIKIFMVIHELFIKEFNVCNIVRFNLLIRDGLCSMKFNVTL